MKIAFNIFYGVFIGLLIVIGALFLVSLAPTELGIQTKIVQSGSMEPSIPVGALIIIKPNDAYKAGDVITFGEDSAATVPTTHRILGMRETDGSVFYTTKGDANEEGDAREVAQGDIIGKVYVSVPYAGFVLNFARQPLGFALLIALPAALVILAEFASILQEIAALWKRRGMPNRARRSIRRSSPRKPYAVEYVRLFETDDVFIPVRIFESRATGASHRQGTLSSTLAVLSLVVLTWYGTSSTLSYFRDTELSTGNTFAAGTWPSGTQLLESLGAILSEPEIPSEEITPPEESVTEVVQEGEPSDEAADQEESVPEDARAREERDERDSRVERGDTGLEPAAEPEAQDATEPEEAVVREQETTESATEAEPTTE